MSGNASTPMTAFLERLKRIAHDDNAAEEEFRRELAAKMAELERRRAFAFRRLTLARVVAEGMAEAKDEEEALSLGLKAFKREIDWTGATEAQRETIKRFEPVVLAIWAAAQPIEEGEGDADAAIARVDEELAAFEAWFAETRRAPFLSVMDREPLNLPLVEIS